MSILKQPEQGGDCRRGTVLHFDQCLILIFHEDDVGRIAHSLIKALQSWWGCRVESPVFFGNIYSAKDHKLEMG